MNRRLFKSLTLWIVPLLIARAMIPAGFMLSAGADGLDLMFCPGSMEMAAAPQNAGGHQSNGHSEHAGHQDAGQHSGHGHEGHDASGGSAQDNASCPFSLAASAASVDVPHLAAAALVPSDEVVAFISEPAGNAGPQRTDRIRGPPLFS